MYSDPFTIPIDDVAGSGNVADTYDLVVSPVPGVTLRRNNADDAGTAPEWLKISHQVVGKGEAIRDRRMVRFEASSVDDGAIGTRTPSVVYIVFDIPRNYKTGGIAKVLLRQLVGFLRNADGDHVPDYVTNYTKLMNGES